MRTAGLRNKPIDRRRLNMRDRSDYNQSGAYGRQAQAVSRARAYRGQAAYELNRPPATVSRRPGSGSFGNPKAIQQARLRDYGRTSNSEFKGKKPSSKGDIFGPKN